MRPTQEGGLQFETTQELAVVTEVFGELALVAICEGDSPQDTALYSEFHASLSAEQDLIQLGESKELPDVCPVLARVVISALLDSSESHPDPEIREAALLIHEDVMTKRIRQPS